MYYDQASSVLDLAKKSDFAIFNDPNSDSFYEIFAENLNPANLNHVEPDKTHKITVDQIREILDSSKARRFKDYYVIISDADVMNDHAQSAFLKLLEEPPENYHFIMQVKDFSTMLPTILSRGDLYILKPDSPISAPVFAEDQIKSYAKQLITAKQKDLVSLASNITTEKAYKKDGRGFATAIVDCAIEITYKSYFKTKNLTYLRKLPKLLKLQESLRQNGHIKLHLVADLC